MKVVIGSKNPAKIKAVALAFNQVWSDEKIKFSGIQTDSGVSPQPLSNSETISGARNRAIQAIKEPGADYGVGLEGGLSHIAGKWFDGGWTVIVDRSGNEGIGSSPMVEVPKKIVTMIKKGYELGEAIDQVFHTQNARNNIGYFGLITDNHITRISGYADGVIMALARYMKSDLF